ncbi:MAG: CoA-binding protein, partial [Pseudomonadota bacterium]|nr:CoA-binding protein [Pseudomonadota bacterium]
MAHSLEPLLHPRAIAVVGASDNAARIGGRPIHFSKSEFQGNIYPINPNRETVQGLKAYAKVGDLPEVPDSA